MDDRSGPAPVAPASSSAVEPASDVPPIVTIQTAPPTGGVDQTTLLPVASASAAAVPPAEPAESSAPQTVEDPPGTDLEPAPEPPSVTTAEASPVLVADCHPGLRPDDAMCYGGNAVP